MPSLRAPAMQLAAGAAVPRRQAEGVVRAQTRFGASAGRRDREGLGRRQDLAQRAALRHGALLHRDDRLAGLAVQGEDQALLGGLDHAPRGLAPPSSTVAQRRLGRDVVVPDVVVGGLKGPGELAGGGVSATTELAWPPSPRPRPP